MSAPDDVDLEFHYLQLREWASGMTTLMGATEALIRTGYAGPGRPWIRNDDHNGRPWIDFERMPDLIGGMSGGQQRLLDAIASLGEGEPVKIADVVVGLDRAMVDALLAGIAQAAGYPELHPFPAE